MRVVCVISAVCVLCVSQHRLALVQEDMWHLYNLVAKGDLVTAVSFRLERSALCLRRGVLCWFHESVTLSNVR